MANEKRGALTRAIAAGVVNEVLAHGRSLDSALLSADQSALEPRDRALLKTLSYGTIRTHLRNLKIIDALIDKPLRRKDQVIVALLSTALHALIDLQTPEYAAVSATVNATELLRRKQMRGFVNAVLRRYLREADALLKMAAEDSAENREAHWQHPAWLIDRLQQDWPDDWQAVLRANNTQAPMCLRINQNQTTPQAWLEALHAEGSHRGRLMPGFPAAVMLEQPADVTALPGFADGACSVQDAAAQLAADFLDAQPGMQVLDACAAPGGKTCHMQERANNELRLTALDSNAERLERVRENLARLQLQAETCVGDASSWNESSGFDRILLDPPCTATGVIRRHPDIRFLRRASDVDDLAQRQRAMLDALWALLKPGGRLLYATCSVLRKENESLIGEFLDVHADAREISLSGLLPVTGLRTAPHGVYLLPGEHATDGFYYALMERHTD